MKRWLKFLFTPLVAIALLKVDAAHGFDRTIRKETLKSALVCDTQADLKRYLDALAWDHSSRVLERLETCVRVVARMHVLIVPVEEYKLEGYIFVIARVSFLNYENVHGFVILNVQKCATV
jgi:hypothetical protein